MLDMPLSSNEAKPINCKYFVSDKISEGHPQFWVFATSDLLSYDTSQERSIPK